VISWFQGFAFKWVNLCRYTEAVRAQMGFGSSGALVDEDGEPVTIAKRVLVDGRGLSLPYTRPHAFTPHLSCCKASLLPLK
jgi:hypothetical protein